MKMILDMIFIFLCFLFASFAFLLDGKPQSSFNTTSVVATDQLSLLKDLIIEERQVRIQLKNQMENLQNYTKSLEQQLQSINNTQSSFHQFIVSENKRLKQDIVTLFQMELNISKEITTTHTKITNTTTVLNQKVCTTELHLRQNWNSTKKFLNTILSNEFKTNDRILALESNMSKTYAKVVQKLGAWSERGKMLLNIYLYRDRDY